MVTRSHLANLHRMLRKAHAEDVRILSTAADPDRPGLIGAQVSSSRPGHLPYVVILSGPEAGCDCPGWAEYGHCKHFALVADRAGYLPAEDDEDPDPEPPAPAARPEFAFGPAYDADIPLPPGAITFDSLGWPVYPADLADEPDPWNGPADLVSGGYQPSNPRNRRAVAAADLARRQVPPVAEVAPAPVPARVRGTRRKPAAA